VYLEQNSSRNQILTSKVLAPPKSTEIDEKHFSDAEKFSNFNFAKAGAPHVPSRTAVGPGPSLGKIKIC